ncbi:MAG: hypothetical protein ONA69_00805 [candidate division KSB1 bacterium]|nr:hypothetical protein [candidate division KSB1 bacterium]MDZ7345313.1 hypothetical protein [candidate division KSB1 bacterium]
MNLLKDKREQENEAPWSQGQDPDFTIPQEPIKRPGFTRGANKRNSRKGSSQNMVLAALLVLLIVLLGYYVGVVKPKQAMKAAGSDEAAVADTLGEQPLPPSVETKQKEEPAVSEPPKTVEAPPLSLDVKTSVGAAAAVLRSALQACGENGRITAFVLDDQSFSIEMETGGAVTQTVVDAFRAGLPSIVSVNNPVVQGRAVMFTGTATVQAINAGVLTSESWEAGLKQMAGKTGLQVVSLSLQSGRVLFAKFRGSLESCINLLQELAKESASEKIDKIIISTIPTSDYTIVLRIQM